MFTAPSKHGIDPFRELPLSFFFEIARLEGTKVPRQVVLLQQGWQQRLLRSRQQQYQPPCGLSTFHCLTTQPCRLSVGRRSECYVRRVEGILVHHQVWIAGPPTQPLAAVRQATRQWGSDRPLSFFPIPLRIPRRLEVTS